MKHAFLATLIVAFLATSLQSVAQETKTKEKTATGEKSKTKSDPTQVKTKTESADGKETKMEKQDDKVVLKGEGAGAQYDSSINRGQTAPLNLDAVRQEINSANQQFGQAFVKGDSATMIGLYHTQARIYPPNMAMLNNRTDMGRMIAGVPASGIQNMQLTTTDVIGSGDLVVETGTFEMRDATKTVDRGKYIAVWKLENGRWRIYRDIWNSDMSMAGR